MAEIEVVRRLEERQWREFVDNHPDSQVFHTPEMYRVFARVKGHTPGLWAAVDRDGQVLALFLPVCITLLGRAFRGLATRAIVYGGTLHAPGEQGMLALAKVLKAYTHQPTGAPLFTELRNLRHTGPAQAILSQSGFVYEDHLNYLIDLQRPPESILQSIGTRTRKHIRRALRQGEVTVEEIDDRSQIDLVYNLLSQTYREARVPLAGKDLFDAAFEVLHPRGMIRFSLARVRGEPAAASVELLHKDVVYGWYGGTDRAYSNYQPNELLTWSILEWGAANGYRVYDFGGAGKPDEEYGVRDFKAKFGGELVCFGRNTCVHHPHVLELSRLGYWTYQRLQGLMPSNLNSGTSSQKIGQPVPEGVECHS